MATLESLKSRLDFDQLRQSGRKARPARWMIVYSRKNKTGTVRLGCTIPRYVGPAVVRNRLRRWCKEYFRQWAKELEKDRTTDISVVFLKSEAEMYRAMEHEELNAVLDASFA